MIQLYNIYFCQMESNLKAPYICKAQHNNQIINMVCLEKKCQQKSLICSHCACEDHLYHTMIPIQKFQGKVMNKLSINCQNKPSKFIQHLKLLKQDLDKAIDDLENNVLEFLKDMRYYVYYQFVPLLQSFDQTTCQKQLAELKQEFNQEKVTKILRSLTTLSREQWVNDFGVVDSAHKMYKDILTKINDCTSQCSKLITKLPAYCQLNTDDSSQNEEIKHEFFTPERKIPKVNKIKKSMKKASQSPSKNIQINLISDDEQKNNGIKQQNSQLNHDNSAQSLKQRSRKKKKNKNLAVRKSVQPHKFHTQPQMQQEISSHKHHQGRQNAARKSVGGHSRVQNMIQEPLKKISKQRQMTQEIKQHLNEQQCPPFTVYIQKNRNNPKQKPKQKSLNYYFKTKQMQEKIERTKKNNQEYKIQKDNQRKQSNKRDIPQKKNTQKIQPYRIQRIRSSKISQMHEQSAVMMKILKASQPQKEQRKQKLQEKRPEVLQKPQKMQKQKNQKKQDKREQSKQTLSQSAVVNQVEYEKLASQSQQAPVQPKKSKLKYYQMARIPWSFPQQQLKQEFLKYYNSKNLDDPKVICHKKVQDSSKIYLLYFSQQFNWVKQKQMKDFSKQINQYWKLISSK